MLNELLLGLRRSRNVHRLRQVGLVVAMLLGGFQFVRVVNTHYPIHEWLFWIYARSWLLAGLFAAACVSSGHAVLVRVLRRTLPLAEHVMFSFAIGVLTFFLGMFTLGILHLYNAVSFFALPMALLAIGAWPTYRTLRRVHRHVDWRRFRTKPRSPFRLAVLGFGVLSVGLLYFCTLTPDNVAYDARWYHLAIAEHYAVAGGVVRFPEGWFLGTYPHLASYLYTWAFLLPKSDLFGRVMLASHVEVAVFLFTLAGIPVLVRRLVPGLRLPLAWVATFLFPGIFIYDSNLNLGADHVAALWAAPIFVALLHTWRTWSPAYGALLAAMMAGALDTKYTAITVAVLPLLAFSVRAVSLGVHRVRTLATVGAALLSGILLMAPHWAKNLVFYGDPLYPTGYKIFTSRPWTGDCAVPLERYFLTTWSRPPRTWAGVVETLKTLWTYSFVPNNWAEQHGTTPVFGSLFTLSLLLLPFLAKTSRLWVIFLAGHIGIFTWYWIHHFDRYLQTLLPWMVAATVAVGALAWKRGVVARVGVLSLAGLQLAWGLDVPFIPSHAMIGTRSSLHASLSFLEQGFRKNYEARKAAFAPFTQVGAALPKGSVVLLHEMHMRLGMGALVVSDFPGTQGGISYPRYRGPAELHRGLKAMGVTHILSQTNMSTAHDSFAGDLVFHAYVAKYAKSAGSFGGVTLYQLPEVAPPDTPYARGAAFLACGGPYDAGLYDLDDLAISPFDARSASEHPKPKATGKDVLERSSFVVQEGNCGGPLPPGWEGAFKLVAKRGGKSLYARTVDP